jgi:hypothetical protein
MNVIMIIPTGIGCEIGGHAGDASPSARLLASVCDNLIIHPNVMNASDINELTDNMWYVEGSVLDRFLQGQIALEDVYSNKILLIVNTPLQNETINSVNGARNTLGVNIQILELKTPLTLEGMFKPDGRAYGIMTGEDEAVQQIYEESKRKFFDVLAIQTVVDVSKKIAERYFAKGGVNPWGGAEAMCSRYFSRELEIQCAHAPFESGILKGFNEVVDPRQAAELVSVSYLHCILKGLHQAPRIVEYNSMGKSTLRVDDIDLLISPDGCWDVPHEACANWEIPIIFVKENKNIYPPHKKKIKNTYLVDNYVEVAGIISTMRAGITPESARRPLKRIEA